MSSYLKQNYVSYLVITSILFFMFIIDVKSIQFELLILILSYVAIWASTERKLIYSKIDT
jgi:hypothetical protein